MSRTTTNKQKRKKEWFDSDEFWRETYPYMFPSARFAATSDEIEKALKLAEPRGKSALDLCCGPGRCSVALSQRGFAVTGVDRTRYLLNKARARARAAQVKVQWIQKDMRDFVRPDAFDLALSMFTSFGFFDDKSEDIAVLQNIFRSLRSGGVCLMEMMGKERLSQIFLETSSQGLPDGTVVVQRREIFDDWTRIRNEWMLIRGEKVKRFQFHHTLYSGLELRERMESVGFTDVKLYGNLDGDPYGPGTPRLIAVGGKAQV